MKLIINTFLQLLLISLLSANTLQVYVSDKNSGALLEGANVIVVDSKGREQGGSTDSDGEFLLPLDGGEYTLYVSFIGYDEYNTSFNLPPDGIYVIECAMESESILIPELSIIGQTNATYNNLAGAATVMSELSIKQISPVGTQEILEHVPGISAFSDDGIGNSRISVGIRGLNPRRSSRVLILEDGVPIQPALYVYPNMYYNPPVERIDGVEVIKGSGTIKYGPQTMGGIINYSTRRPSLDLRALADVTIGNNGYKSSFLELNGFGKDKIKNAIQLLYKTGDGFRQNNGFEQINGTFKTIYSMSNDKNIYSKLGVNYENSNATYTGMTEYSFSNDPTFNPKEHDNFKIFRTSFDLIETYKMSNDLRRDRKLFISYFDRRWWRENDIFTSVSNPDLAEVALSSAGNLQYYDDIIRVGNGEDNFGILRTFYVAGIEQTYKLNKRLFGFDSDFEIGSRIYWEKFIDNKQTGDSPDAREGIYYYDAEEFTDQNDNYVYDTGEPFTDLNGNNVFDATETIVGQSHHYETIAFSTFISNSVNINRSLTLTGGLRLELFEQERLDLLDGASYLDQTTLEVLPSLGFILKLPVFNIFGGVHRGYTSPSSGALKSTTFSLDSGLDLHSEKSWNKEIGIRTTNPGSKSNLELSFFHIDIQDMVAAGRGGQFGVFQNLGSVTTMGSELSMYLKSKIQLIPALHLVHTFMIAEVDDAMLPGYTFMPGTSDYDISGNILPYTPMNTLMVGIEQRFWSQFTARLDFKYVDKVYTDFHNIDTDNYYDGFGSSIGFGKLGIDGIVPAYHIFNMSASYNPTENIGISLTIKNLTDEIYIGSLLHSNPGQRQANMSSGIIPGPRRQINLGIKVKIK